MAQFFRLDGQAAIVTGSGSGIGAGIARRLHAAGARIAIFDCECGTCKSRRGRGGWPASRGRRHSARRGRTGPWQSPSASSGPLSIVVNNAGIAGRTDVTWNLDVDEVRRVFEVNMIGPFLFCKAMVPRLLERGYGRIVNVASIAGKEGNPTLMPYSASKAAVIALTKSLAKELAGKGDITVNAISPAVIRTAILDRIAPATVDYMVSKIPMGRTGTIDEVAALVHYLVSPEASFTTGQCYDISGGRATY